MQFEHQVTDFASDNMKYRITLVGGRRGLSYIYKTRQKNAVPKLKETSPLKFWSGFNLGGKTLIEKS